MARTLYCLFVSVVITTFRWRHFTKASPCDGSPDVLNVDYIPKRIFSPGYPNHYNNNLRCEWVFEGITNQGTGFGIQLTTLEIELDAPFTKRIGKCNDSLEVFEGMPSNLGQSLGKWCGKSKHVIKTLSNNVTLRFLTNEYYVGKGFVIEYSLVRVASAECWPGKITPVHVGRAPLYETFDVKNPAEKCTWTMEAIDQIGNSDPKSALVIEAFNIPFVPCEHGHFIIYDGQDTRSRLVLKWCDVGQMFSKIYLSSSYATLGFFFEDGKIKAPKIDPIQLKLYTRDTTYACNDTHLPSINVGEYPVYFSLPFSKSQSLKAVPHGSIFNISGSMCDVHVSEHIRDAVRIEVLNVSSQETTCETDAVNVRPTSQYGQVKKLCNRYQYPMYLPLTHDLIVGVKNASSKIFLRAFSDEYYCGGLDIDDEAYDDMIVERYLPKAVDFTAVPRNCYNRHVITARNRNQTISLHVQWNNNMLKSDGFTQMGGCDSDYISVYDGNNESAPLLFSSCKKSDRPHDSIYSRIIGTRNKMLILYNTADARMVERTIVKYYAVPVNAEECKTEYEISVTRSIQTITSPNYPDFFPMDYTCSYVLTAVYGDVIVVVPVDTKFTAGCGDILNVYEGSSWSPWDVFGRICGHDKISTKFVSKGPKAVIRFSSDKFGSSGGWKLWVYSRHRTAVGDKAGAHHMCLLDEVASLVLNFTNPPEKQQFAARIISSRKAALLNYQTLPTQQ